MNDATTSRLRSFEEIQRAHDRLHAIVNGEIPSPFNEEAAVIVVASLDVLCWVLHHDHNTTFADNMLEIDEMLARNGIVEERRQ